MDLNALAALTSMPWRHWPQCLSRIEKQGNWKKYSAWGQKSYMATDLNGPPSQPPAFQQETRTLAKSPTYQCTRCYNMLDSAGPNIRQTIQVYALLSHPADQLNWTWPSFSWLVEFSHLRNFDPENGLSIIYLHFFKIYISYWLIDFWHAWKQPYITQPKSYLV